MRATESWMCLSHVFQWGKTVLYVCFSVFTAKKRSRVKPPQKIYKSLVYVLSELNSYMRM